MKVIVRKLGREKALGLADTENKIIEIDPRQSGKTLLDTEIHELLHIRFPDWTEKKVAREASVMARFLWKLKYRKINE